MTGKDEVFIEMIEFALEWGFVPSSKDMKKYNRLVEVRKKKLCKNAKDECEEDDQ
jgi:hypothetical protein